MAGFLVGALTSCGVHDDFRTMIVIIFRVMLPALIWTTVCRSEYYRIAQ